MRWNDKPEWFPVALILLGLGVVNAAQIVVGMRAEGMHHAWSRLFFTLLASWLVWALAAPVVLHLGHRFPPIRLRPFSTWLIHLAACTSIGLACSAWTAWLQIVLRPWGPDVHASLIAVWGEVFSNEFYVYLILYSAILAAGITLDSRRRLAQQETEAARLNAQLAKAQLDALRRQLEPHFLFNTLNAIAGLVREKRNDTAVDMIAGLSDLLRHVLKDPGRQEVSLGEEVEFLSKYLGIQKMRFAQRLQFSIAVPLELHSAQVPSLILQPMVENAIQHGIGKLAQGGAVRVSASRSNGQLTLNVRNDGPSLPANWEQEHAGIGVANVRARLQSLYGAACALNLRNHNAGGVEVSISLPYRADGL